MYHTKQEVDKHVASVLGRIRDEKERNCRGFQIARLYYEVKEYEVAKRYLAGFLSVKEKFAPAYKLMGQIQEALDQVDAALEAYKTSLQLDDQQKDVVLKIGDLYTKTDMNYERARYWADRTERLFPGHEVAMRLREIIYSSGECGSSGDLEELISAELAKRPGDVKLRVKLLKLYVDQGRVNEAYTHVVEVEKKGPYEDSVDWYRCVLNVFQVYQEKSGQHINGLFHRQLLSCTHGLLLVSMSQCSVADVADVVHKFDQHLLAASQQKVGELQWQLFLQEMQAALYFHMGTLILKRAQKEHLGWTDALWLASACYLASYSTQPLSLEAPWYVQGSEDTKKFYSKLRGLACFRASQVGHMLKHMSQGDSIQWMNKVKQQYCIQQNKNKLYESLFTLRHMKTAQDKSYLLQTDSFTNFVPSMPADRDLVEYDDVSHMLWPSSLHHLVWLALQRYTNTDKAQPHYAFRVFETLQYGISQMDTASPDTLCQLDTQAFFYATVWCSSHRQQQRHQAITADPDQLLMYPVSLCTDLCSEDQKLWWAAAYTLYSNTAKEGMGKLRVTLQRGLESVRLVGQLSMAVRLVVHLAHTFGHQVSSMEERPASCTDSGSKLVYLQALSHHYWRHALQYLQQLMLKQNVQLPKVCLFAVPQSALDDKQIRTYMQDGRYFLATQAMSCGRHQEALEGFQKLETPYASYNEAKIYQRLVPEQTDKLSSSESEEKKMALLTKARDALYLTLDRIRGDKFHPLNSQLASEIDEIESQLTRLNPENDGSFYADALDESDIAQDQESHLSSAANAKGSPAAHSTPSVKARGTSNDQRLTPGMNIQHVRPSPERLDAQIRSLAFSQDAVVRTILEKIETLIEQNRDMLEEMRESRKMLVNLTKTQMEATQAQAGLVVPPVGAALSGTRPPMPPLGPEQVAARQTLPILHAHQAATYFPRPAYIPEDYEYGFAAQPGYPVYPGAPLHPYGYKLAQPASGLGTPPQGQAAQPEQEDFFSEDYYIYDEPEQDEDEGEGRDSEGPAAGQGQFHIQDSQLIQEWPYGNAVSLEGKSTLTYSPSQRPMPQPGFFGSPRAPTLPPVYAPPPPQNAAHTMPGPGYFSTPPQGGVNTRYPISTGQLALAARGPGLTMGQPKPSLVPAAAAVLPANLTGKSGAEIVQQGKTALTPGMPLGGTSHAEAVTGGTIYKLSMPASMATTPAERAIPTVTSAVTDGQLALGTALGAALSGKAATFSQPGVSANSSATTSPARLPQPSNMGAPRANDSISGDEAVDTYQGPDFEPIIPLPQEVEVKTGEEDEKIMFKARAKLFRFVEKQWKERGVGELKILHNEANGQIRVVMRRDQVFKVCANHSITSNMEMNYKSDKEDKVLVWGAMDFADDEAKLEKFCARFKTAENARMFKDTFENAKAIVALRESGKGTPIKEQKSKSKAKEETKVENFAQPFQTKTACWESATVVAGAGATAVSFGGQKAPTDGSAFSFGGENKTGTFSFGSGSVKFGSQSELGGVTFGSPGQTGGVTFGSQGLASGFKFGSQGQAGGVTFGSQSAASSVAFGSQGQTTAITFGSQKQPMRTKEAPSTTTATETASADTTESPVKGLDKFKPKEGSWDCETCYVNNGISASNCIACETPKPVTSDSQGQATAAKTSEPVSSSTDYCTSSEILAKFKPAEGSWNCEACYLNNGPSAVHCVACETPRPGAKPQAKSAPASAGFVFGSVATNTSSGFQFGGKPTFVSAQSATAQSKANTVAPPAFQFGSGNAVSASSSGGFNFTGSISFGSSTASPASSQKSAAKVVQTKAEEKSSSDSSTKTVFGGLTFSTKPIVSDTSDKQPEKPIIHLKSPQKKNEDMAAKVNPFAGFSFNTSPTKPDKQEAQSSGSVFGSMASSTSLSFASVAASGSPGSKGGSKTQLKGIEGAGKQLFITGSSPSKSGEEAPEDYEPDSDFKPIVPLPDLVEVKTGEEGLEKLFSERAKLFRLDADTKAWKERGVGELKILHDKGNHSYRILMRREQVLKVCANHNITTDMKLLPLSSSDKAWCWSAQDYAESELKLEKFAVKLKNADIAAKFKDVFEKCQKALASEPKDGDAGMTADVSTASDDGATHSTGSKETGETTASVSAAPHTVFGTPSKTTGFKFGDNVTFTFTGVTPTKSSSKPLDLSVSPKSPELYQNSDGEDSHIHFEPVVPLPAKVQVKTGEEEEKVLYCHRAKLYRFTNGEWKERGVGDVKLLKHKTTNRVRLLMRREQVLKICVNHCVDSSIDLKPMPSMAGKAWLWHAEDYSEGTLKHEQFALRFKNAEIAEEFKEAVEAVKQGEEPRVTTVTSPQTKLDKAGKPTSPQQTGLSPASQATAKPSPSLESFSFQLGDKVTTTTTTPLTKFSFTSGSAIFAASKSSPGSSVFGGRSPGSSPHNMSGTGSKSPIHTSGSNVLYSLLMQPVTDEASKDDVTFVWEKKPTTKQIEKARKLQLPDTFYLYKDKEPCPGCIGCDPDNFDPDKPLPPPSQQPSKVKQVPAQKVEADSTSGEENVPSIVFGGSSGSSFSFASLAAQSSETGFASASPDKPFKWKGAGAAVFGSPGSEEEDVGEEDEQDIHFKPVMEKMPDLIEVKTGEEEEEVMFTHRAKLYRWDNKQWKERGTGDIKLLKHRETGSVRILMRREQVLKVCCNHKMTPEMNMQKMSTSEAAWCWFALDFTEGQPRNEKFAVRFKSVEVASLFKQKFDELKKSVVESLERSKNEEESHGDVEDDDDEYEDVDDEEEEEEEDEENIMFEKRVTLKHLDTDSVWQSQGVGDLQISYDEDVNGARVYMKNDAGKVVCNHIICREYVLKCDEGSRARSCEWMAKDFSTDDPARRTFRVDFSSHNALLEFADTFEKGRELAVDSEIYEQDDYAYPREIMVPEVVGRPGEDAAKQVPGSTSTKDAVAACENTAQPSFLGTCSPEVSAALDEITSQGSQG